MIERKFISTALAGLLAASLSTCACDRARQSPSKADESAG